MGLTMQKRRRLLLVGLGAAASLFAASDPAPDDFPARKLLAEGSDDICAVAFCLKDTYMTPDQWRRAVADLEAKYRDWEHDTGGGLGRYLNDRLVTLGLAAVGGKIESIQRIVTWMAFYEHFNQVPPRIVTKLLREHRHSLLLLLTDFTWEKASIYIREKQWRDVARAAEAPPRTIPGVETAR